MNTKAHVGEAIHCLFLAEDTHNDIAVRLMREREMRAVGFHETARDARVIIRSRERDMHYALVRCLIHALYAIQAKE